MFNINTPISPRMEMVVSIMVQDKKVCFNERLKNSLNIQKPESFTCEPKTLFDDDPAIGFIYLHFNYFFVISLHNHFRDSGKIDPACLPLCVPLPFSNL